ncbi:MAG: hypothetical protein ACK4S0_12690 [Sediminibacterium sp.]|nr:hypothetical protein [uncultured Sediminibacterium sp.]
MKYSQQIGIVAAITLIVLCFFPWSIVTSKQLVISGFAAEGTSFGRPGLFHAIFCSASILFFAIPRIWAKRTNVFIGAINLAWAIRNYILVSSCMLGECPEKQPALYAILALAILIQLMVLFPKIPVGGKETEK